MGSVATGKEMHFAPTRVEPAHHYFSVTHDMLGDPFWAVYRNGLRDASERFGCSVTHLAPQQYAPPEMVACLDRAREAQPDGIIATVPDPEVADRPLRRILGDGIPLIAVNMPDPRPDGARIPYATYVGPSDTLGGRLAAERLLAEGIEPARVLCVDHYLIENASHRARREGLLSRLEPAGVEMDLLRVQGSEPRDAESSVRRWLNRHDVGAVCTLGPPGAAAVLSVQADADHAAEVRHGSFDLSELQLDALESGRLLFTIDSQQYLQGFLGVAILHLGVELGFALPGDVPTGPRMVERGDAAAVRAGVDAGVR